MRRAVIATTLFALSACESGPTYWQDVAPIVNARCAGCHQPNAIGPFDLSNYAGLSARALQVSAAVRARTMPPWIPGPGNTFRHERRLTDTELDTIVKWVAAGAPEGDAANPAPAREGDIDEIRPDLEVKMKQPYQPDTRESDDYRCFVLDPKLTAPVAVTGFDFRPGDKRIVHHVILFAVDPRHRKEAEDLDAADVPEGYTCFGDAHVDSTMVGAWVPGTTATAFPYGTGVIVEDGSVFVMQVHYNTLEVREALDQTTALLETAPQSNITAAYIVPIGDYDFVVPPGEVKTTSGLFDTASEGLDIPNDAKVLIHGVAPHMHLHGTKLTSKLTRPDGSVAQLVDVPEWKFGWQQLYFYEEPIEVRLGDKISIDCTFDNRPQAQPFVNGVQLKPGELRWGEGTLAEMCLNFMYVTVQ